MVSSTKWLQISSGRGPTECSWVVNQVYECITREAGPAGLKIRLLEAIPDEHPRTFKSIFLAIEGEDTADTVAAWLGTVQWIGASPFRPHHKRRNWFVKVESITIPEKLPWREEDVKVESMLASGPGGQHVNKVETAVRVTHVPTGLTAVAREERSQHLNRKLAFWRLSRLLELRTEHLENQARQERWNIHHTLERGNPIRVYVGPGFTPKVDSA